MLRKETAFPRWRAMDRRWNKNTVSLLSSVTSVIRLPISWTSSTAIWFHVPAVSMASGKKRWVPARSQYLEDLLAAALSAAAPGRHAVSCRWDSAYVSGTVISHAKGLPLAHGRSVTPSGRLPSCRIRLTGSLTAGICALFIDRHRMSFMRLWRCCLGALLTSSFFSINWFWWNGNVSVVRSQVRRCVDIAVNWLARLACGRSERYRSLDWARRWMDEGATSLFIINLSASVRAGGVPGGHYTWYSRAWVVNDAGSGGGGECLSRDRETQVRFVWGRDVRSVGAAVCPRTRYFASSAISQR